MTFNPAKNFIFRHYIFLIYSLITLGLLIGLYNESDSKYSVYVAGLYILPFVLFYWIGYYIYNKTQFSITLPSNPISKAAQNINPILIVNLFILFILAIGITHSILIKACPGLQALLEFNYDTLIRLRKSASSGLPVIFSYLYSFTLRAVVPFAIVYTYLKGNRMQLAALMILAFLVALNGMQKSYFLSFYFPLVLLLAYQKKFIKAALLFAGIALSIVFMVYVTNPSLKYSAVRHFSNVEESLEGKQEVIEQLDNISVQDANQAAVNSIFRRTIFKPGQTVGKWFEAIPAEKPFLYGKGYKLYALFTGEKYHDYSTEMYPILYPHYAARGYLGTVNVASFMYDYSNWGLYGLPISAFITAMLLLGITILFSNDSMFNVALNTTPVLLLSSTNYTSLLFSGGWGLIIILYLIFLKKNSHAQN